MSISSIKSIETAQSKTPFDFNLRFQGERSNRRSTRMAFGVSHLRPVIYLQASGISGENPQDAVLAESASHWQSTQNSRISAVRWGACKAEWAAILALREFGIVGSGQSYPQSFHNRHDKQSKSRIRSISMRNTFRNNRLDEINKSHTPR